MIIEQIYTGCLAEASYYIESEGEAVIIDPLREAKPYLEKLNRNGAKLKYIFETHFHADFVSGHLDLSKEANAPIVFGPDANPDFEVMQLNDGDELQVGKLKFKLIHTPGHTLESSCYLLFDENNKEKAIFTGDTLFIGDVGRPDLAIDNGLTKKDLAKMMFHSLREKIMVLPDDITIYPAHGAGSACGKKMSDETFDSLGNQKANNYALRADMTEDDFVSEVLDGIAPPPEYFALNAMLNKQGYSSIEDVVDRGTKALDVEEFEAIASQEDVLIIDTRHQQIFNKSFIPSSLFFGLKGSFAPWVASVLKDIKQKIVFVCDAGKEKEVVVRLARVGFDHVLGFLKGGIDAWVSSGRNTDQILSIPTEEFRLKMDASKLKVLDVRKPSEFGSATLELAINQPLDYVDQNISDLDKSKQYYVFCRSGYRSMVYASMMKKLGFKSPIDVIGGFNAIAETPGFKILETACKAN